MKFYDEISKYYDLIFPYNENTERFLKENIDREMNILDVACATGTYTEKLATDTRTRKAIGIDLDEKMIEMAKEKSINSKVEFKAMDMLKIDTLVESFGLIYCIGNSLVHLPNRNDVSDFLNKSYGKLVDDGVLIIQTINFERIFNQNLKGLPTIEAKDILKFKRDYFYNSKDDEKLKFHTELEVFSDGVTLENEVELLTLKRDELIAMLEKAGFKNISVYGDYNGNAFDISSSQPLIIKAVKRV